MCECHVPHLSQTAPLFSLFPSMTHDTMQSKLISPVNASLSFLYSISCSLPYEHYIMNISQDVSTFVSLASSELKYRELNFFCSSACICDYYLAAYCVSFDRERNGARV